ncbi:polysaccharide pyruvyl transferase family protein, partial [Bifidobacterium adolescentis]
MTDKVKDTKPTIAVVTLHNSPNYGSCLQTYATQTVLSRIGATPSIVDYYRHDAIPENETERALNGQLAKKMPIFRIPGVKSLARIPVSRIVARRAKPLNDFRQSKLALTDRKYYSVEALEQNPPQADIYCTGSDQVWNSTWNEGFNKAFYLSFAPEGAKRIAYAASIGKSSLEDWEKPLMRDALNRYSHISVREAEAAELLNSIGVHGAVPVIDPTLMLNRDDWSVLRDDSVLPAEPYILVYQLNKNHEFDQYVQRFADKTGLPVYRIAYGVHEKRKGEHAIICPTVGGFVSLFMNAEYVITDSFHGTAFSMNLERKFVAISPGRFSGRIMNLLEMTGETSHYLD